MIRTDPNLDRLLRSAMVELLRPHPNFLFIADGRFPEVFMNDDIGGTINRDRDGYKGDNEGGQSSSLSRVWSGVHNLAARAREAARAGGGDGHPGD